MVLARGSEIRLANDGELTGLFPGRERGALPPFGSLYGQSVCVDVTLASESEITFSAGTHTEAICLHWPSMPRSSGRSSGSSPSRSTTMWEHSGCRTARKAARHAAVGCNASCLVHRVPRVH